MRTVFGALLALCLTGCLVDNEEPARQGYDTRYFENRTFTDTEIGYSLHFPAGWRVKAATTPLSSLDLYATQKKAEVYVWHTDIWEGESLAQYVANRSGENFYADSEVVFSPVERGGVTVYRVDQWFENEEYIDYEWVTVSVESRRTLYFYRNGRITSIRLSDEIVTNTPSNDFNPVDSSLTFF